MRRIFFRHFLIFLQMTKAPQVNVLGFKEDMEKLENDLLPLKITDSIETWSKDPEKLILYCKNGKQNHHFSIQCGETIYFLCLNFAKATFFPKGIYVAMPRKDFDPTQFAAYTRRELPNATKKRFLQEDTDGIKRCKVRIPEPSLNLYFWRTKDEVKVPNLITTGTEKEFVFSFDC